MEHSAHKTMLVLCNLVLVLTTVLFALGYSTNVRIEQEQMEQDAFCATVESMKQISTRYLETELDAAQDWAAYIQQEQMSMDEALTYLRAVINRKDRAAHIVDMETFAARTTNERPDGDTIGCYQTYLKEDSQTARIFISDMRRMFTTSGHIGVLGKYKIEESQIYAISVGTRVNLRMEDGESRPFLLLRVISVESMKQMWLFPIEYTSAEIGLVNRNGDYVIQSASMRAANFIEFIRSYNFAEDYNGVEALLQQLRTTDSGLLEYKNSKGEVCYWYYSAFADNENLDIMGYIPEKDLHRQHNNWSIVLVTCGMLLLLGLLDGAYVLSINRALRETAVLAEQASVAKTQFLSSMSHDIRTPMNVVLGMTELAKKRVNDPAYVSECLDKITNSGSHLLTLINDILDISKVESGRIQLNPAVFSLAGLLSELENIVQAQAEGRKIHFQFQQELFAWPYLVGDSLRLSQVYLNLLTNAVKYTEPGGDVRLRVQEKPLPKTDGAERVMLVCTVSDNGLGMSEDFQRTMYDSFSRATDSRIDKIQGTGLGLYIVKRMVELMQGTIDCESQLGEGTTFTVRIPLQAAESPSVPSTQDEETEELRDLAGLHLLAAEDNDLNWEILQALLAEYGISCDRAENGQDCVEQLEAAPLGTYDLVLMDVQMPVLNGRDAARRIRQSNRADLRAIPIAAMTADAFAEDVQACLDAGMDAHLAKPIELKKVVAVLHRLCRQKRE